MAFSSAAASFRCALLSNLRLPAHGPSIPAAGSLLPRLSDLLFRGFSAGFLDKDAVTERVLHVAKHFEKVDPAKVTPTASFEKDLGLDSLDIVELVMALEEEFNLEIPDKEADKIQTVAEAVNYIFSNPMSK